MKKHSRFAVFRGILLFWCLFIGVGAVAGAVGMITRPDGSNLGMQSLLPYFQVLPFAEYLFQDYLFPGFALLVVNGLTNLCAAVLILCRKRAGIICGGIFGITLMAWICIQFVIFPMNFMSTSYFIFGLLQAISGYAAYVFLCQENFAAAEANAVIPESTSPSELVVYFSRMGYTRKIARDEAARRGADLYEIRTTEKTEGTGGFWWCGRFAMHRWDMELVGSLPDFSKYEKIILCSPVWAFGLSSPMRHFCRLASGKITRTEYFLVHFQKASYRSIFAYMDALLGLRREKAVSICFRLGKEISRREVPSAK